MRDWTSAVRFVPEKPRHPERLGIGIIGCGGIVRSNHIPAYKAQGFTIVAVSDINAENARKAAALAGGAAWYTDHRKLLARKDVVIVDAATHPAPRVALIADALNAGKHVLSQKPFVLDLKAGARLAALAKRRRRLLAVNQNGRWDPARKAAYDLVRAGAVGEVLGVHLRDHWDHNWVAGTSFDIKHCLLYDYAIHNFDLLTCLMWGREPLRVHASSTRASNQRAKSDMVAQAMVEYRGAQATLVFDASAHDAPPGGLAIAGTKGSITTGWGGLELRTAGGTWKPKLWGSWFPDGFKGTMGHLMSCIETGRKPWTSAADNLKSLQLCFAACVAADRKQVVVPRTVTKLPPGNVTA